MASSLRARITASGDGDASKVLPLRPLTMQRPDEAEDSDSEEAEEASL